MCDRVKMKYFIVMYALIYEWMSIFENLRKVSIIFLVLNYHLLYNYIDI